METVPVDSVEICITLWTSAEVELMETLYSLIRVLKLPKLWTSAEVELMETLPLVTELDGFCSPLNFCGSWTNGNGRRTPGLYLAVSLWTSAEVELMETVLIPDLFCHWLRLWTSAEVELMETVELAAWIAQYLWTSAEVELMETWSYPSLDLQHSDLWTSAEVELMETGW